MHAVARATACGDGLGWPAAAAAAAPPDGPADLGHRNGRHARGAMRRQAVQDGFQPYLCVAETLRGAVTSRKGNSGEICDIFVAAWRRHRIPHICVAALSKKQLAKSLCHV